MALLEIADLNVEAEGKNILKGVSLSVNSGDCVALLGPNGHGKSTLLNAISGNPRYHVSNGTMHFEGSDVLSLSPDARSKAGIFMAFQNPPDVPGVVSMDFFRAAINARVAKPISLLSFYKETTAAYQKVDLDSSMASRHLNEGYSGGEKKRNEVLQMLLLKPKLALLDEIDSGLDVDALKIIAQAINELKAAGTTFLIISHYERLYELVHPNRTAVMVNGRIALEGDSALATRISTEGYGFLEKENGIVIEKEDSVPVSIGVCAVKPTLK